MKTALDLNYHQLEYEELKTLHFDIGNLLKDRKQEELEKIRAKMQNLGMNPADLVAPKPVKGNGKHRYQHPDDPSLTYGGKGPKPQWLKNALEDGRQLEEFLIAS